MKLNHPVSMQQTLSFGVMTIYKCQLVSICSWLASASTPSAVQAVVVALPLVDTHTNAGIDHETALYTQHR